MTALSGLIRPCRDGRFERLSEFEPGAVEADFMHVREQVDDPIEQIGDVFDVIAWQAQRPGVWWTQRGLVTVIGEHELQAAWWGSRAARMVATPADHARDPGTFCVVDWTADINAIIGRNSMIECSTPALYKKLRETLIAQAMPRGLTITTRQQARRAA
jgi:hypothetical protein